MTASKTATRRSSPEARIKSDLAKVDSHEIGPGEYEEIPEITDAMVARAKFYVGGKPASRGRPRKAAAKVAVSIRLSPRVLAHFRAGGSGWQTRINDILLDVARREGAAQEE